MLAACGGERAESDSYSRSDGFLDITPALLSGKIFYYQYEADGLRLFERISITDSDSLNLQSVFRDDRTGDANLAGDYPYSLRKG